MTEKIKATEKTKQNPILAKRKKAQLIIVAC